MLFKNTKKFFRFFLAVFSDSTYLCTPIVGRKRLLHLRETVPLKIIIVKNYLKNSGGMGGVDSASPLRIKLSAKLTRVLTASGTGALLS